VKMKEAYTALALLLSAYLISAVITCPALGQVYEPPFTITDELVEGADMTYKVYRLSLRGNPILREKYKFRLDVPDNADFDLFLLRREIPSNVDFYWLKENSIASSYQTNLSVGKDEEFTVSIGIPGDYWLVVVALPSVKIENSGTYTLEGQYLGVDYTYVAVLAVVVVAFMVGATLLIRRFIRSLLAPPPPSPPPYYWEAYPPPQLIVCPYCNHEIPADSIYCPMCGARLR